MSTTIVLLSLNLAAAAVVLWRLLAMSQAQADAIKAVTAQINRSTAEIKAKVQNLEDQLANAGVDDPAVTAALEDLKVAANANDDIAPPVGGAGESDSDANTPTPP